MTLKIGSYMTYVEEEEDRAVFQSWELVFEAMGIEKVLYCSCSYWGYGGDLEIDLLLKDGRVASYDYAFDSCCDRLDYEHNGTEVEEDIKTHTTFFDTLTQYDEWVDTLPDNEWDDESRVKVKKARS